MEPHIVVLTYSGCPVRNIVSFCSLLFGTSIIRFCVSCGELRHRTRPILTSRAGWAFVQNRIIPSFVRSWLVRHLFVFEQNTNSDKVGCDLRYEPLRSLVAESRRRRDVSCYRVTRRLADGADTPSSPGPPRGRAYRKTSCVLPRLGSCTASHPTFPLTEAPELVYGGPTPNQRWFSLLGMVTKRNDLTCAGAAVSA